MAAAELYEVLPYMVVGALECLRTIERGTLSQVTILMYCNLNRKPNRATRVGNSDVVLKARRWCVPSDKTLEVLEFVQANAVKLLTGGNEFTNLRTTWDDKPRFRIKS